MASPLKKRPRFIPLDVDPVDLHAPISPVWDVNVTHSTALTNDLALPCPSLLEGEEDSIHPPATNRTSAKIIPSHPASELSLSPKAPNALHTPIAQVTITPPTCETTVPLMLKTSGTKKSPSDNGANLHADERMLDRKISLQAAMPPVTLQNQESDFSHDEHPIANDAQIPMVSLRDGSSTLQPQSTYRFNFVASGMNGTDVEKEQKVNHLREAPMNASLAPTLHAASNKTVPSDSRPATAQQTNTDATPLEKADHAPTKMPGAPQAAKMDSYFNADNMTDYAVHPPLYQTSERESDGSPSSSIFDEQAPHEDEDVDMAELHEGGTSRTITLHGVEFPAWVPLPMKRPRRSRIPADVPDMQSMEEMLVQAEAQSVEEALVQAAAPYVQNGGEKRSGPSAHCHVCNRRSPEGAQQMVCFNFKLGKCRKVVCMQCLTWYDRRQAEDPQMEWTCLHCRGRCPPMSYCYYYGERNKERYRMNKHAQLDYV